MVTKSLMTLLESLAQVIKNGMARQVPLVQYMQVTPQVVRLLKISAFKCVQRMIVVL